MRFIVCGGLVEGFTVEKVFRGRREDGILRQEVQLDNFRSLVGSLDFTAVHIGSVL